MDLLCGILVCLGLSSKEPDTGEPDKPLPAASTTERTLLLSPKMCTTRAIDVPGYTVAAPHPSRRRMSTFSPPGRKRAQGPPKIIIHCVRHAEAEHNVPRSGQNPVEMHDPPLTDHGIYQCAQLLHNFPVPMEDITHVYSSPSTRCIHTTSLAFRPLTTSMATENRKITLWMELKDLADLPCNSGTEIAVLKEEFRDVPIEYRTLPEGWEEIFPSNEYSWKELAMKIREVLWDLGNEALRNGEVNRSGNVEMLVVSHQGLLAALEGDVNKRGNWRTAQHKIFEFLPRQAVLHFNTTNPGTDMRPYSMFIESKNSRKGASNLGELNSSILMDLGWDVKEVERLSEIFMQRAREQRGVDRDRGMALERELRKRGGEMGGESCLVVRNGKGDGKSEVQKKTSKSVRAKGMKRSVMVGIRMPAKQ